MGRQDVGRTRKNPYFCHSLSVADKLILLPIVLNYNPDFLRLAE